MLALLRAQLWLKPVDDIILPSSKEMYDDLLDLAYRQTVVCFVSAACLRHKDVDKIPTEIREEMEAVIEENKKIHEYHNKIIVEVFTLLENNGLHPILLKGQGLAQLYPQPELRQCGDIDIYIGQADYEKACRIMDGYCGPMAKENSFYEDQLPYHISNGCVTFEIHRKAADAAVWWKDKVYNGWASQCLNIGNCKYTIINGKNILTPSNEYNIIFVFDHLLKHYVMEGVCLRQFCDWLMMSYDLRYDVDSQMLKCNLTKYSSLSAWQVLGGILVFQLEFQSVCFPLWKEKKAIKSQSYILSEIINAVGYNFGSKVQLGRKFGKNIFKKFFCFVNYYYRLSRPLTIISYRCVSKYWMLQIKKRIFRNHQ